MSMEEIEQRIHSEIQRLDPNSDKSYKNLMEDHGLMLAKAKSFVFLREELYKEFINRYHIMSELAQRGLFNSARSLPHNLNRFDSLIVDITEDHFLKFHRRVREAIEPILQDFIMCQQKYNEVQEIEKKKQLEKMQEAKKKGTMYL